MLKFAIVIQMPETQTSTEQQPHPEALVERIRLLTAERDLLLVENEMLLHELNTDAMTDVLSERGMYQALDRVQNMITQDPSEWYWRPRLNPEHDDEPVTALEIVTFDLNEFKKLNDTYGHAAGNEALATFADILKTSFRETDIIARAARAGDEFIIVAPVPGDEDGFAEDEVREKLLASIEDIRGLNDDETIFSSPMWTEYFGTSFGIARLELRQGMDLKAGFKEAFDIADQRMFANKGDKAR